MCCVCGGSFVLTIPATCLTHTMPPPAFTALLLLTISGGIITTAALPYLFWCTPQTRFALVVSLLLVYALLTLAPLVFLRPVLLEPARQSPPVSTEQHAAHTTPVGMTRKLAADVPSTAAAGGRQRASRRPEGIRDRASLTGGGVPGCGGRGVIRRGRTLGPAVLLSSPGHLERPGGGERSHDRPGPATGRCQQGES